MDQENSSGVATCAGGEVGGSSGGTASVDGRERRLAKVQQCTSYIFAGFTEEGERVFDLVGPDDDAICLLEELDIWLDEVRAKASCA